MTKSNITKGILLFLGIIGILLAVIFGLKNTGVENSASDLDRLSQITLADYDGNAKSLGSWSGKMLVVNSWAAWCPFCRKELVDFVTVQREFGDKVIIIAVDRAETQDIAKKYTDELGITSDMVFLLDPSDSFYQSIGGFSMPETIFVDKDGRIVDHKRGPMDVQEMRERIQKILN